jgi:hypothetical protein
MAEQLQYNRALMESKAKQKEEEKTSSSNNVLEKISKAFVEKTKEELARMNMAEQLQYNRALMDHKAK